MNSKFWFWIFWVYLAATFIFGNNPQQVSENLAEWVLLIKEASGRYWLGIVMGSVFAAGLIIHDVYRGEL